MVDLSAMELNGTGNMSTFFILFGKFAFFVKEWFEPDLIFFS